MIYISCDNWKRLLFHVNLLIISLRRKSLSNYLDDAMHFSTRHYGQHRQTQRRGNMTQNGVIRYRRKTDQPSSKWWALT